MMYVSTVLIYNKKMTDNIYTTCHHLISYGWFAKYRSFPAIVVSALSSPSACQSRTPVAKVIPASLSALRLTSMGIIPTRYHDLCQAMFCSLLATFVSFFSLYSVLYFYSPGFLYSICTQSIHCLLTVLCKLLPYLGPRCKHKYDRSCAKYHPYSVAPISEIVIIIMIWHFTVNVSYYLYNASNDGIKHDQCPS